MTTPSTGNQSYVSAAKKDIFPTKEQAIVIDAIEGVPINDYINAVGLLINPSNIRFVSRISQNRICMFLATKDITKSITENHLSIQINDKKLEIRPLISQHKRIILSNVCPVIPHVIIERELEKLQIKLESPITFLRAGISAPGFAHILSFRRQVYINPNDVNKIPESMSIEFENTKYWIYPSADNVACFICKKQGHLAKHCSENPLVINEVTVSQQITQNDQNTKNFQAQELSPVKNDPTTNQPETMYSHNTPETSFPPLPISKRALSTTNSKSSRTSSINNDEDTKKESNAQKGNNDNTIKHPTTKKQKIEDTSDKTENNLEAHLQPIKEILSSTNNPYVLNYIQLKSFLEKTKGNPNVEEIALEYHENIPKIIECLREIYPHLNERSIKNRITRITKKLSNTTTNVHQDSSSICSESEETFIMDI